MKTITVVQDPDYHEAIYIDGEYYFDENTIFACEIAKIADGKPFKLEFHHCHEFPDAWPTYIDNLTLEQ